MRRSAALIPALALLTLASGCVTRKVQHALEKETRASLTVSGDATALGAVEARLSRLSDVRVTIDTIEKGVEIIRIVGAYAALMNTLTWLVQQNLQLLANDEVTKSLLSIAIAALK